jgi:C-terminal peptidase prc
MALVAAMATGCVALRSGTLPGNPGDGPGHSQGIRTAQQLRDWSTAWSAIDRNFHTPGFNGVDWRSIEKEVVDRIQVGLSEAEFTALVDETLARLGDGHTYYLDPQETATFLRSLNDSNLTGVGLTAIRGNGDYAVVGVTFPGGPADKGGIASHDRIHAIDGQPALGADGYPEVFKMRGPPGTKVTLHVSTPGGPIREVPLVREQVDAAAGAIKGRLLGDTGGSRIGYILYAMMPGPRAGDLLRAEFSRLSMDRPLDGLVLDLRGNTGDNLEALSSSLGLFMEGVYGNDQVRENRHRKQYTTSSTGQGNSREVPLVVLVDKETASAGELMAGALQSAGRARLVGSRTAGDTAWSYGFRLPGGGLVSVGVSRFLLPDGSDPGWYRQGIQPDWQVAGSGWDEIFGTQDPGLRKAVELLLN